MYDVRKFHMGKVRSLKEYILPSLLTYGILTDGLSNISILKNCHCLAKTNASFQCVLHIYFNRSFSLSSSIGTVQFFPRHYDLIYRKTPILLK